MTSGADEIEEIGVGRDVDADLAERPGEVALARGKDAVGQEPEGVDNAFVAAGSFEATEGGLDGRPGDGGDVTALGEDADDAPPGGGVGEGLDVLVAHDCRLPEDMWTHVHISSNLPQGWATVYRKNTPALQFSCVGDPCA
jgi:hypothetical protein